MSLAWPEGSCEGIVCDSFIFSGIWEGGCPQEKVKASGKTVYGGRKKCEKHLGVKEVRAQGFWDQ